MAGVQSVRRGQWQRRILEVDIGQNMLSVNSEGGRFVLDPEGSSWKLLSKEQYGHIGIL